MPRRGSGSRPPKRKIPPRRWPVVAAILVALGGGGSLSAYYFFPLETLGFLSRVELWRGGVKAIRESGLEAYSRSYCVAGKPCDCVALIHGLGDRAMTWKKLLLAPASAWDEPLRLYAWNLPGTGGSTPPSRSADYRVKVQAETLSRSMRGVCPRWTVVGNSLGGWVAAWVALEHPELVERLVLVDSWGLKRDFRLGKGFELSVATLKEFQRRAYYHPRRIPDRIWPLLIERARKGTAGAVRAAQVAEDVLDSRLGKIRVPTLIIWGKSDRVIPPASGKFFAQKIRKARFLTFPRCGHLPQKECAKKLISAMGDFFLRK